MMDCELTTVAHTRLIHVHTSTRRANSEYGKASARRGVLQKVFRNVDFWFLFVSFAAFLGVMVLVVGRLGVIPLWALVLAYLIILTSTSALVLCLATPTVQRE
jgi:hypothetical protein